MRLISYKLYNNPKASWLSYIIAILSFGRYTHSELLFSNGLSLKITYGEPAKLVIRTNIDRQEWDTSILYVTDREEEEMLRYVKENIVGKSYDLGGALLSIFKVCTLQSDSKVFCSEAIADVLRMTQSYSNLNKGCMYSPVSLHHSISDRNVEIATM